jgi:hypothetical protein
MRRSLGALASDDFSEIALIQSRTSYGFRRWQGDRNVLVFVNLGDGLETVQTSLGIHAIKPGVAMSYTLHEVLSSRRTSAASLRGDTLSVELPPHSTRVIAITASPSPSTGSKR